MMEGNENFSTEVDNDKILRRISQSMQTAIFILKQSIE